MCIVKGNQLLSKANIMLHIHELVGIAVHLFLKAGMLVKHLHDCFCGILDQGMKQGRFVLEEKVQGTCGNAGIPANGSQGCFLIAV